MVRFSEEERNNGGKVSDSDCLREKQIFGKENEILFLRKPNPNLTFSSVFHISY
jgi:hypothetical protein